MRTSALSAADTRSPEFLWRNGALVPWEGATVHVNAVGHASVAGVFEGIKAYRSDSGGSMLVFRLREHMQRLIESVRLARISIAHDVEALESAAIDLLHGNKIAVDAYLRPWCFVRGIVRQLLVPEGAEAETIIDCWPFTSTLGTSRGVRVCVSSWRRIDDQSMPPRVKAFSNYYNARLAALEATRAGFDGTILLDREGKVTEGPASCVALVRKGVLVTPPVSSGLLDSITRDTLLRLAREELGIKVVERPVDRSELYLASEIFFMGTAWEILPIFALDGLTIGDGAMGPVAQALDHCYTDVVRGRVIDRRNWITQVTAVK